jgi:lipopolysaccharide export system permease protein
MTQYDRYLAARFLKTLAKVLASLILLFILVDLLSKQGSFIKDKVSVSSVFLYYIYLIPTILFTYQVTALSVLLAALMVFGHAAQDGEITALLAGGISIRRISRGPILVALIIAILSFLIEDSVGATATINAKRIFKNKSGDIVEVKRKPKSWSRLVPKGVDPEENQGWTCHIDAFDSTTLRGEGVLMHKFGGETLQEIRAEGFYWNADEERWQLTNGTWATFYPADNMSQRIDKFDQVDAPFHAKPARLLALEYPPETKSSAGLRRDLREARRLGMNVERYRVDYYAKFARPALSFVMIWLAIPFAIRLRKGGIGTGFGLSIAIGVSNILLFYLGMGMGHWEMMNPIWAAWLPNLIFLGAGVFLFIRTPT